MAGWKFIEGITEADYAFEATGKTLAELFTNAAEALENAMVDTKTVAPKQKRTLGLTSEDLKQLLFDFLCELVFLKDAEQLVFSKFNVRIEKKKVYMLHAELLGDKIDATTQKLGTDVKAVTMHEYKLEETVQGWKCQVVLDV